MELKEFITTALADITNAVSELQADTHVVKNADLPFLMYFMNIFRSRRQYFA